MIKKILSLFITLSLLLGVFSITFADAEQSPDSKLTEERINVLLEAGIVNGSGGYLNLEKSITRSEFSSVLAKIIVDDEEDLEQYNGKTHFSDIDKDSWVAQSVNILFEKGIVNGYNDGTFRSNNEISFNEAIVMIVRSLDVEVDTGDFWSDGYVKKAKELGILDNVMISDYSQSANRERIFELIYNTIQAKG